MKVIRYDKDNVQHVTLPRPLSPSLSVAFGVTAVCACICASFHLTTFTSGNWVCGIQVGDRAWERNNDILSLLVLSFFGNGEGRTLRKRGAGEKRVRVQVSKCALFQVGQFELCQRNMFFQSC